MTKNLIGDMRKNEVKEVLFVLLEISLEHNTLHGKKKNKNSKLRDLFKSRENGLVNKKNNHK